MTIETLAATRRMGVESSEIRAQLIEAAAQIVREDGCAAVTARRLAEMVGLKRPIVHYYFRTIEDLLIAVIRRDGEMLCALLRQEMESDDPLRAIWQKSRLSKAVVLEFVALASHRKAVQTEVKRYTEEVRRIQVQALTSYLDRRGIKPIIPPVVMLIVMMSVSQTLAIERMLDVSEGHAETAVIVEEWLNAIAKQSDLPVRRSASKERMPGLPSQTSVQTVPDTSGV